MRFFSLALTVLQGFNQRELHQFPQISVVRKQLLNKQDRLRFGILEFLQLFRE